MNKLTFSDRWNIEKYNHIDEGFEAIRPDLCKADSNYVLAFHIEQLKYHRAALEHYLKDSDNWEGGGYVFDT
ncbi:hypothetical protein AXI64_gp194 [Vibrio phage qdvp001]|uniref:hypothetical protein n=1 Tax=Vibrio phage qdvp001 TaxID=1003177 RepID=UPI00072001AD|nr:hypothetical protein AXI64_gp194 [Vibrio phage qdvp001]ALM62186.1 hypothetical protein qdvp001_194 [Vibrio phage qdvp001]